MTDLTFVSVVVITYEDQLNLDRVLDALERQECPMPPSSVSPAPWFEVVVADDGSDRAPVLGERSYRTKLVRQADRGFLAAAARNLGAAEADGGIVVFLDGDTIPEPGCVWALAAAAGAAGARAPGGAQGLGLAVGRRRHADLGGLDGGRLVRFLDGSKRSAERVLTEPAWLADGLRATDNLAAADDRSYRFVISAVLALTRPLLERTGGFDDSFVGYGGEDWDLAHRCWLAGAEFVHEPSAVAWHDGPDVVGRAEPMSDMSAGERRKNREVCRLANVLPDPMARDSLLLWEIPRIAVELDDRGMDPQLVLTMASALVADTDARVWLSEGRVVRDGWWPASDPRAVPGPVPEWVTARATYTVRMDGSHRPAGTLHQLCGEGSASYPGVQVWHGRDRARAVGQEPPAGNPSLVQCVRSGPVDLEAEWGGWKR